MQYDDDVKEPAPPFCEAADKRSQIKSYIASAKQVFMETLGALPYRSYASAGSLDWRAKMNPNKALWEKGDFTRLAACMRDSGAELVASLGVGPEMRVLDLGCGDGTTAIPSAQAGADVLGVDIASNLVAAGNARAAELGLSNIAFQEGDASALTDLADHSFDLVVSIFGAMFAPRPYDVAAEIVRVTRPGGRIVMGNWIPGDPTLVAQVLKISASYAPPPPEGFISPVLWGKEDEVRARFADAGVAHANVTASRELYTFRFNGPPAAFLDIFRTYYGPTMNAFEAAEKGGRAEALQDELLALFERENVSGDAERTEIPAAFLKVVVRVA
jgi:SAM-dependent methyltransferase